MRNCTKLAATLFNTRTFALFTRVWCSNLTWHVDIVLFFSLFSHNTITSKVTPFSVYLVSLKVCMQVWTSRNSKFPSLGIVSCHREVWVLHSQKHWACCTACTILYCTVLYCTVLYCTVLFCTVLYCTVLYCTVLYCTVLYCTVLYCLYNRLQQYYADLFFTVNNIEQYYSSWMGCNNAEQYC
jgi:hypothetical protein